MVFWGVVTPQGCEGFDPWAATCRQAATDAYSHCPTQVKGVTLYPCSHTGLIGRNLSDYLTRQPKRLWYS